MDHYKSPETNFAAGMLPSNTIDMAKYAQALLDRKFLSPNGYRLMWKTREGLIEAKNGKPSNWAFGWTSTNPGGRSKLAMNGARVEVVGKPLLVQLHMSRTSKEKLQNYGP